ncbi:unnamed protein product [Hyaloperonospora brassicae]|uniref:Ribosome biogenesis protein SLX9 n=1 Tax=Hyaloperonospora brassicae TaxID=162125 RepID=A0AAV0TMK9_HYABA|nr:unnamed protein product [Hyaloperonospora brassicae]
MATEDSTATRAPKKQRTGGPLSTAASTTARAKFAFGSRLPDAKESKLKRPKMSGNRKHQLLTSRMRWENSVRTLTDVRTRRRSASQDSDEATTSKTKPVYRNTALSSVSSHLPALTKVPQQLSYRNGSSRLRERGGPDEQERVADLEAATTPTFWIKRRKEVEAAMKELDAVGERIMAISSLCP